MSADLLTKINLPKPSADATARSDFSLLSNPGNSGARNEFPSEFQRQMRENATVRNTEKNTADHQDRLANAREANERADRNRRVQEQRSNGQRIENQRIENQRVAARRAEQQQADRRQLDSRAAEARASDAQAAADRAAQDRQRAEQAERSDPRNGNELPENKPAKEVSDSATGNATASGDANRSDIESAGRGDSPGKPGTDGQSTDKDSAEKQSTAASGDVAAGKDGVDAEGNPVATQDTANTESQQTSNLEEVLAQQAAASDDDESVAAYLDSALTDPALAAQQGHQVSGEVEPALKAGAVDSLSADGSALNSEPVEDGGSAENSLDNWLKEQLLETGVETASLDSSADPANEVDMLAESLPTANADQSELLEPESSVSSQAEPDLVLETGSKIDSETVPLEEDGLPKSASAMDARLAGVESKVGVRDQKEGATTAGQFSQESFKSTQAKIPTSQSVASAQTGDAPHQNLTAPFQMKAGAEEMAQAVQAASKEGAELGTELKPNTSMLPVNKGDLANELAMLKKLKMPGTQIEPSLAKKPEGESDSGFKTSSFGRALEQFGAIKPAAVKPMSVPMQSPLNNARWAPELSDRMLMMVSKRVQVAEIRIDPPDLGPVDVKVRYTKEQAHVTFTSHIATVRDAIEQAVPKLREMFEESGLGLGDVDVQDKSQRDQQAEKDAAATGQGTGNLAGEQDENSDEQEVRSVSTPRGLVDYYA